MNILARHLPTFAIIAVLTGCSYKEVERDVGYKGRARVNPWLAAERFCETSGHQVISTPQWRDPEWEDAVWFIPGSLLRTRAFTQRLEDWIDDGGHLVVMLENADSAANDWARPPGPPPIPPTLEDMLENAGIAIHHSTGSKDHPATKIEYLNRSFRVDASSRTRVSLTHEPDADPGVLATTPLGGGRITVLADARIFRNRWIDTQEHAALLAAILEIWDGDPEWRIGFMRGSGLSFWRMLGEYLWAPLVALATWLLFWLWRGFGRFGPLRAADEPSTIRNYEHHLEALGGFHWEVDHANGLLAPIRNRIMEIAVHHAAAGKRDEDLFAFLAERTGLSRERVSRALTEARPADAATLTRTTADIQSIIHSIS